MRGAWSSHLVLRESARSGSRRRHLFSMYTHTLGLKLWYTRAVSTTFSETVVNQRDKTILGLLPFYGWWVKNQTFVFVYLINASTEENEHMTFSSFCAATEYRHTARRLREAKVGTAGKTNRGKYFKTHKRLKRTPFNQD